MLLEAARHVLDVEWTETLAAAEAAGDPDVFGYPSMVAYLKHRLGMAGGRAHRYVKNARAALKFSATFSSWKHRQITGDEAELLFRASERLPDRYPDAENVLLELVGDGFDETRKILDYWRSETDVPGLEPEQQMHRRHFDVIRKQNGMVAGEFALPTVEGEALLTAVDVLMSPPAVDDTRTTSQRRADALGDLARSFLEGARTPTVGGERPHLVFHVDGPGLQGKSGGLHETEDGWVVDPAWISMLTCDATVSRIVFGPGSELLDYGRQTRTVPRGLRRAVVARDRHCVAPGCGRSAKWCDVHHIIWWVDGGETVITNLCLLCRYHHTQIHLGQLKLEDLDLPPSLCRVADEASTQGRTPTIETGSTLAALTINFQRRHAVDPRLFQIGPGSGGMGASTLCPGDGVANRIRPFSFLARLAIDEHHHHAPSRHHRLTTPDLDLIGHRGRTQMGDIEGDVDHVVEANRAGKLELGLHTRRGSEGDVDDPEGTV